MTGYDEIFLGTTLPLPRPLGDEELRELDYPRFTVLLDPVRRLAAVTAVNIDGATLQDLPRTGFRTRSDSPRRKEKGRRPKGRGGAPRPLQALKVWRRRLELDGSG